MTPQPEQKSETPKIPLNIAVMELDGLFCVEGRVSEHEGNMWKEVLSKARQADTLREQLEQANNKLSLTVQAQIEASAEALDWKQKHTELFFEGEEIERELRERLATALSQLTALTAEVEKLKGRRP